MAIKHIRSKWNGTMTDRERFNRQMHYKSVDRCFNMEFGYWDENFDLWDIFVDNGIRSNEQAAESVSYTHLDVYKRQVLFDARAHIGGRRQFDG